MVFIHVDCIHVYIPSYLKPPPKGGVFMLFSFIFVVFTFIFIENNRGEIKK